MALIFSEGFDWETAGDLTLGKWDNTTYGYQGRYSMVSGATTPFGTGQALQLDAGTYNCGLSRVLGSNYGTLFLGFRYRNYGAYGWVVGFWDVGNIQTGISQDGSGRLQALRSYGTTLCTTSGLLSQNTWYYVEIGIKLSATTGWVEIYVNNALQASYYGSTGTSRGTANGNTVQTANAYANALTLDCQSYYNYNGHYYDDLYLCDSTGALNNDVLGDTQIYTIMPTGAGHYTQWTRGGSSPAATNYQSVNEVPENGDTSYVQDSTVGDIDTYAYGSLPSTATVIRAVVPNLFARKGAAGNRHITTHLWSSGGESDAPSPDQNLANNYLCQPKIMETNPLTSAAWAVSDLTGLQFGPKVTV